MAVNQIEEDEGPLEAEDVGPDPYDDDEADTVAIKGDYKKQFSAERTTNQWVMLGIKSGGLSIGLLSAGQYEPEIKMAGTLLLIPSIFCALWGGLQYRRRTNNIEALSKACHPRATIRGESWRKGRGERAAAAREHACAPPSAKGRLSHAGPLSAIVAHVLDHCSAAHAPRRTR
uniref:DUF202 domain-containing protein n=1 Tax=Emiliania huxleyi TaxID=2903 RepID=A0A6U9BKD2_EMIHU